MRFLLDTNILGELTRRSVNPGIAEWAKGISRVSLSAVTVEEIAYGLAWRPNARVQGWLERFLDEHCIVLEITREIAQAAGHLRGGLQSRGETRSQADMLICATAAIFGLTLVTRNTADFKGCGVALLDPYRSPSPPTEVS
ncbi:PIN domain-containing protein [bacterium]|nr:PIN domain-containing protein [bacterium]